LIGFSDGGVYVAMSEGTSLKSKELYLNDFGANHGLSSNNVYPRDVADVDGDGRDDLIAFKSDGVYVSFTNIICSDFTRDPENNCECKTGYTD
jgi:hypothetical protein